MQNFGQPTDIDHNGKIVILFTKEVNKLTTRGSNGVVGGFFFDRDLFPATTQNGLEGCPTTNFGEMFYVLVPDPNAVFSDKRTASDVLSLTPGTLAHEYQHLINASRRLYVNTTSDYPEVVWLNEGLSHIAEELLFYKATGLAPRQNIDLNAARTVATQFANYQGSNFGRFNEFLSKPTQTSPYADNDDLNTRGATWNLLRYLADHKGSSDGTTWSSLVNTPDTGQTNLSNVFGSNYLTQIRDWATSVIQRRRSRLVRRALPRAELEHAQHFPVPGERERPAARQVPAVGHPALRRAAGEFARERGRRSLPALHRSSGRAGVDRLDVIGIAGESVLPVHGRADSVRRTALGPQVVRSEG